MKFSFLVLGALFFSGSILQAQTDSAYSYYHTGYSAQSRMLTVNRAILETNHNRKMPEHDPVAAVKRVCNMRGSSVAAYGCELPLGKEQSKNEAIKVRGGVSEFSNKASLGVAVVVSW